MKVFYVLVLVLVAGAVPSHGRSESVGTVFNKTQLHESMSNVTVSSSKLMTYPYDFSYLAMQWPRSVCNNENVFNQKCELPYFTVHGLWPQSTDGHDGINCFERPSRGQYYQPNKDPALMHDLDTYWPDLTPKVNDYQRLWRNEYNKHGSCTFNDQNLFFSQTLKLAKSLSPQLSMLPQIEPGRRIIPGRQYWPMSIKNAVREVTSVWPTLNCVMVGRRYQLLEIRFCAFWGRHGLYLGNCNLSSDCVYQQRGVYQQVYLPPAKPLRP